MKTIFWLVLIINLMNSCKEAKPATYYLPNGFEGVFVIVYSQSGEDDIVKDGRRQFYIPDNRILLTSADFSDGWRNDLFLIKSENGYDTLKMFLPNMDTSGKKFDKEYYEMYTSDINSVAVNFRQIINSVPINNENSKCKFEYELITVGRAANLNDTLGIKFKNNLDKYLEETICNDK